MMASILLGRLISEPDTKLLSKCFILRMASVMLACVCVYMCVCVCCTLPHRPSADAAGPRFLL